MDLSGFHKYEIGEWVTGKSQINVIKHSSIPLRITERQAYNKFLLLPRHHKMRGSLMKLFTSKKITQKKDNQYIYRLSIHFTFKWLLINSSKISTTCFWHPQRCPSSLCCIASKVSSTAAWLSRCTKSEKKRTWPWLLWNLPLYKYIFLYRYIRTHLLCFPLLHYSFHSCAHLLEKTCKVKDLESWSDMYPGSPRPNKEWSLGWSIERIPDPTYGQSLVFGLHGCI